MLQISKDQPCVQSAIKPVSYVFQYFLHVDKVSGSRAMNDFKFWNGGCTEDEFNAELKEAAWNILHENPGSDFGDWQDMLIEQYPTEVVDALGTNPPEVYAELSDWWESMGYDDGITDLCYTFRDWAEYFATERSVELYDLLVEAKRKIRRLESVISSKQ